MLKPSSYSVSPRQIGSRGRWRRPVGGRCMIALPPGTHGAGGWRITARCTNVPGRAGAGRCPWNCVALEEHCRACGASAPYWLSPMQIVSPFRCPECRRPYAGWRAELLPQPHLPQTTDNLNTRWSVAHHRIASVDQMPSSRASLSSGLGRSCRDLERTTEVPEQQAKDADGV